MKRLICIRDDDTNFFTKCEELRDGYGEFWGKIPVTLATVPFAHGSERKIGEVDSVPSEKYKRLRDWERNASVEELNDYHVHHPVGRNAELVEMLRPLIDQGMIEIAQHGISHRYNEFGPEMYADNVSLPQIKAGKEYLERVFNTKVGVFVPPGNTVDPTCARYINSLGMELLCSSSLKYRTKLEKYLGIIKHPADLARITKFRLTRTLTPRYKRNGIYITNSPTFDAFKEVDDFYRLVIDELNRHGAVSITTHYRLMNELDDCTHSYRAKFQRLLRMLSELENVEFVTASTLIGALKAKNR